MVSFVVLCIALYALKKSLREEVHRLQQIVRGSVRTPKYCSHPTNKETQPREGKQL